MYHQDRDQQRCDAGPGPGSALGMENSDQWRFRDRVHVRRRRARPGSRLWWALFVFGGLAFLVMVYMLLDRTSATAGPSSPRIAAASPALHAPVAQGRTISDEAPARVFQPTPDVSSTNMVFKCVAASGAVSLQSQPCAANERTSRAIYAAPETQAPRQRASASPAPTASTMVVEQRFNYLSASRPDTRDRQRQQCVQAQWYRQATLERVGMKRTYDLLQRLNARVYDACKTL